MTDVNKTSLAENPNAFDLALSREALERVLDVKVEVTVELGRRQMRIAEVLALTHGSVVELLKGADEPLEIRVNGQLIARGEAVVVGERYGIRVTEVVSTADRLKHSGLTKEHSA